LCLQRIRKVKKVPASNFSTYNTDAKSSQNRKKELKKAFKHLDICSNEVLDKIDYEVSSLDKALIRIIPYAYKEYINNKNNTEL
jgi:hypothetical protein